VRTLKKGDEEESVKSYSLESREQLLFSDKRSGQNLACRFFCCHSTELKEVEDEDDLGNERDSSTQERQKSPYSLSRFSFLALVP
jgi:hypothetical protein